jgi:hypothetical protein
VKGQQRGKIDASRDEKGDEDCAAIFDDLLLEERAAAIAAVLRKGAPSSRFCRLLAAMIDGQKNFTPFVLKLGMGGPGQPAKGWNVELGKAMIAATAGVPRGKQKLARYKVAEKFGVSEKTASNAMKAQQEDDERRLDRKQIEREGIQEPDGKEFDE